MCVVYSGNGGDGSCGGGNQATIVIDWRDSGGDNGDSGSDKV